MEPATTTWAVALGGLAAADVWLARTERTLLTHVARRHPVAVCAGLVLFGAHVLDVLGRVDPFRAALRAAAPLSAPRGPSRLPAVPLVMGSELGL